MTKLDPVANIMPHLITRLHGLKDLHGDTAYFAENLKLIQQTQADLQLIASETKQGLEKMTMALQENQAQMLLNIQKLQEKR